MELGTQIKKYRNALDMSQDVLAEKVYVSRQTISNWENDKSYPDINSLLRLSEIFDISLDTLIKGDVEKMREQIKTEDREQFNKLSTLYTVLFLAVIVSPIPLTKFLGVVGIVIWAALMAAAMYVAVLVEKKKKAFHIQTYREIVAFSEGKTLDEIAKTREEGKRPYQKILLSVCAGLAALVFAVLWIFILR